MRLKPLLIACLALAVLGFAGLAIYWHWAAEQVAHSIAQWSEEQRARGYQVAYEGPRIGGFPVKLDVRLGEPRIVAPQGWRWSGASIAGEAAFWRPRELHLALPLEQELDADWLGERRRLTLVAESARARIVFGSGQIRTGSIEMRQALLRDERARSLRVGQLRYELLRRAPGAAGYENSTLFLRGLAESIVLPEGYPYAFGQTVERLSFDLVLIGEIAPGEPAEALARWRDAGGLVEVEALELRWGPLALRAQGTAALDSELRPEAAFTARIAGLPEAIDVLMGQGLLEPNAAMALRLGALALAKGRDPEGRPVVELPLTVQDGLLYLGPAALFPIGPVL